MMEKHKRLKSGWVGDTISYLYLLCFALLKNRESF